MNIVLSSIGALSNPKESARITLFLLAKELQKQGHDIRIIAKGTGTEEIDGFPIYRTTMLKIPLLLRTLHREKKIDIIHSFSASPLFALPHLCASGKKIHTLKSYSKTKMGKIGHHLLWLSNAVTVPTKVFASSLPIKKNVHIIHSFINQEVFFPRNKTTLKKKHAYQKDFIILYYGALWGNKGVDILLNAIPRVITKNPQAKLLISPRYKNIQEQQALIHQLGIERKVQWILGDAAIEEYVALADVVVLPYKNLDGTEGNPSCMLEAMASKTIVVTTDLPELREIGEGSVLFAQPSDPQSLAETISAALTMKNKEKNALLQKAYEKSKEFDSKKIAQKFIKLYHSVL